jgi:tetratricopeptide (TPR) repeat protein
VEIPEREYQDHVISAKIRLESLGGYAAAGIIFHIMEEGSYYLALISSKGYFRLDAVKDSAPKTLIAWTEISGFDGTNINLGIITYGTYLIFTVNGKWVGEISDGSIAFGGLGFALASYTDKDTDDDDQTPEAGVEDDFYMPGKYDAVQEMNKFACKARLDFFSVDTRSRYIEECFKKWTNDSNINAEERLRLAETFAVMGEFTKSMEQIVRAWKRRDEAIRSVASAETEIRTKKELLLASRISFRLGQYKEAEEYADMIIDQWPDTAEGKFAYTEKLNILNELNRFAELKEFVFNNPFKFTKDINYCTILARSHWELKEYEAAAKIWEAAFEINRDNGIYAANAGNSYELAGFKKEALMRYIDAGKIFLNKDNKAELEVLMPKLSALGEKNWEARALTGKWSFSIEDYDKCEEDFKEADKLRQAIKPNPKPDPAIFYLWGLVLNLKGNNKKAIDLLEKAVKLAPDYGLFRFKLAEIKLLNGIKEPDPAGEFKAALEQIDDPEGRMAEYAEKLLKNGYN